MRGSAQEKKKFFEQAIARQVQQLPQPIKHESQKKYYASSESGTDISGYDSVSGDFYSQSNPFDRQTPIRYPFSLFPSIRILTTFIVVQMKMVMIVGIIQMIQFAVIQKLLFHLLIIKVIIFFSFFKKLQFLLFQLFVIFLGDFGHSSRANTATPRAFEIIEDNNEQQSTKRLWEIPTDNIVTADRNTNENGYFYTNNNQVFLINVLT